MGLTVSKLKNLEDKAFNELLDEERTKWRRFARDAQNFARKLTAESQTPRPDDVARFLSPMIEVDQSFRDHQEENRARGKRFVGWFTDYVIDTFL